jgi:hypothetical protein
MYLLPFKAICTNFAAFYEQGASLVEAPGHYLLE